jgi:hypothetical protein
LRNPPQGTTIGCPSGIASPSHTARGRARCFRRCHGIERDRFITCLAGRFTRPRGRGRSRARASSLDDLVRPRKQRRRNRQPQRLGGLRSPRPYRRPLTPRGDCEIAPEHAISTSQRSRPPRPAEGAAFSSNTGLKPSLGVPLLVQKFKCTASGSPRLRSCAVSAVSRPRV